jgi:hypothetical protein
MSSLYWLTDSTLKLVRDINSITAGSPLEVQYHKVVSDTPRYLRFRISVQELVTVTGFIIFLSFGNKWGYTASK